MKNILTIFDENGDDLEIPARWDICGECEGNGTSSRHVEHEGGGITASEMAEAEHDDPGFSRRYFGGFYDRSCECCKGTGKVLVADPDRMNTEQRQALRAHEESERLYRSEERFRAMGYEF